MKRSPKRRLTGSSPVPSEITHAGMNHYIPATRVQFPGPPKTEVKMDLQKVNEILEQQLNERREVVRKVEIGFPKGMDQNYSDLHAPVKPFGTNWGRGVLFKQGNEFRARIGSYSTSHAALKSGINLPVEKTFYFGFGNGTLYLQRAAVGTSEFTRPMLIEIATALTEEGPLKGSVFRLNK